MFSEVYPKTFINRHPLRILVVTETFPPEINGVSKTLHRMLSDLLQRGHEIILVRPRQSFDDMATANGNYREVLVRGAKIPFYEGLRFGFPEKRLLRRLMQYEKPDLVHVVTEGPLGLSAVRAARHLKLPVVSDFRTNFHSYARYYKVGFIGKLVHSYLRSLHNLTHATLAPTAQIVAQLTASGYNNVKVVARGIDTALFHPARKDSKLRKEWGLSQSDLAVLYVGRLAPEKNLDLLVKSFRKLQTKEPKAKLILVGDGPSRDKLKAENPDFFFSGMRKGEDLARHYASGDLFLFPSLTETFGNVVMEAMASGLPIVAYDYAAAREYLSHGKSALLPAFDKEDEFAEHACILAENRSLAKKIGVRARKAAESCSWEDVADTLESVYAEFGKAKPKKSKSRKSAKLKVAIGRA
ncbi:glycosyltransferase, group 1 family protein [Leptospira inadai serovar Lyme str. 10]|uniref:Glycosyltransferase, group 1 family protein n=2 Tax=Leptospira inadai serovar Lyme TaxID=293084 RepID=V6H9E1_9LEPT|nr:glycosyltransferase family 1 protein [Leptospira inadai]EQA35572.1 glycosyltransferase, group 1 family protein [Leptospira inadai serovar Lyme str. 10]PNV71946.1 glycoside hydrolase [Leptospira inadai serovar Lyme]